MVGLTLLQQIESFHTLILVSDYAIMKLFILKTFTYIVYIQYRTYSL